MAASEVAVSPAILGLRDLLSKSEDIIISKKLTERISDSISILQEILNQETWGGEEQLLLWARRAEQIAEEFLGKLFRHQMSKLQKGRFTKVFDLVRFFPVMNRGSAGKKMAEDFMTEVGSLFSEFTSSRPPAGLPDNERLSSPSSSKRDRENTRQRVESDIVGRDKYVKRLLAWLIDDDDSSLRVISVVGKRACGKTALVRSVFSKPEIKHRFDCLAWVRVTDLGVESDRMKSLLVDILKQIPLRDQAKGLEHKQEEQLFEMLHKLLMDQRYLIVVDDLGEASLINKLLVPFVDPMNGSRVIVITFDAKMRKFADPWMPNFRLRSHMKEEEGKKLLRLSIMGDDDSESGKTILEPKILSKCNGSPPAITLLGGLLSAVEESNWEALIDRRLRECPTLNDIMCLSFDELPCMMKLRVLYVTLFPKESEVPTRRLFRQWAAEGLLAEAAADRSVQMRSADDCLHELESRNLIHIVRRKLDGSARSCRMPAFLHEFFSQKANEARLLQIQYSSESVSKEESRGKDPDARQRAPSCHMPAFLHELFCPEAKEARLLEIRRRCDSVQCKESRGMGPEAEQSTQNQHKQEQNTATGHYGYKVQFLKSFASFNTRKLGTRAREIEDLLKSPLLAGRPDLLRVLDLEDVYKPVLPKDLGNTLSNLRYLGLRWTALDSIPESVGNLLLLETLDLKHTNITKVTSAIWNAKNLRHLYLSEASFDESIQRPISCTKLETLWGLSIKTHDSPMIRVLEKLHSLKKLGVTCHPGAVEAVTKCIPNLARLESLRLRSRDLLCQPASLDLSITNKDFHWPEYLSKLYLLGSLRLVEALRVLPGNLKVLTLSMSELQCNPMRHLGHLSDLIVLRLLARSYTGKSFAEPQAFVSTNLNCKVGFPKLRVLKLWMLDKLEELVVKQGAMCNLEELEIRQCEKLGKVDGLEHIKSLKSVSLTRVDEDLAKHIKEKLNGRRHTLVKEKELVSKKEIESK